MRAAGTARETPRQVIASWRGSTVQCVRSANILIAGLHTFTGTHRLHLRRFPYSVVYRIDKDRILIVAFPHDRQRPGYWRSRR
jgi:hypothetical protein